MTKFKVGDRVRHKTFRTEHTVEEVDEDELIKVDGRWMFGTKFEPVEPAKRQDDLPPDWAIERVNELYRAENGSVWDVFARYITTKEQPPEPPEVVAARAWKGVPFQGAFLAGVKWAKENLK